MSYEWVAHEVDIDPNLLAGLICEHETLHFVEIPYILTE